MCLLRKPHANVLKLRMQVRCASPDRHGVPLQHLQLVRGQRSACVAQGISHYGWRTALPLVPSKLQLALQARDRSYDCTHPLFSLDFCDRGGIYILVAVVDVKRGAELTQSYLESDRFAPTAVRRGALLASKWMTCGCPRCSSEVTERCRGFRCRLCRSGTVWLPGGGACDGCGVEADDASLCAMDILEAQVRSRVDAIDGEEMLQTPES